MQPTSPTLDIDLRDSQTGLDIAALDAAEVSPAAVREALAAGQLEVHYQPVMDLVRREVVAVEALLRWRHPTSGLLLPEQFLPAAEASGAIADLGRWVLETACAQAASWAGQGLGLDLAVNLSAGQVADPGLVVVVTAALHASGLAPGRLILEITESAVTVQEPVAAAALTELHGQGIRLAIDDFGTGFSSLLHLKRYPVAMLKVDASFVAGLGVNADDDTIVASVVRLAQAMAADSVAEGVETIEQLLQLEALGCHRAQGFLFGAAVPASELPRLIDACEETLAAARPAGRARSSGRAAPPVAPDVRERILQLHASGASPQTIAAALNQLGSPHPKGTRWHAKSVARFLATAPPATRSSGRG